MITMGRPTMRRAASNSSRMPDRADHDVGRA